MIGPHAASFSPRTPGPIGFWLAACAVFAAMWLAVVSRAQTTVQPATANAPPPADRYTVLRCGTLLGMPGREPMQSVTVVVKNETIEQLVKGLDGPDLAALRKSGAEVREIDLRDTFVLPGLIDCHVHITFEFTADARLRTVTESDATMALRSTVFAKRTLEAGFTTVRDVGSGNGLAFALRDAIERGDVIGPRILAAGEGISVTGGHGDGTNGYRPDLFGVPAPTDGIADGADECRKAVRHQIKLGADCIKMTATGGVLSASTAGLRQHFFDDELKAIIDTAHSMGRKAAAHAHGTDGINAALRAGVDSIEHGTYLDDESVRLFKERGAYLVPTLLAGATVAKNAEVPGYYLPMVAAKAREVGPRMLDMFRKAHAGGVKIAFGTDTGVSPHGENAREFSLMVQGGMTPAEAIRAATVSAADLCGLGEQLGAVEGGKAADLIAVAKSPLADITELERVIFVMKSGVVVKAAPSK